MAIETAKNLDTNSFQKKKTTKSLTATNRCFFQPGSHLLTTKKSTKHGKKEWKGTGYKLQKNSRVDISNVILLWISGYSGDLN